MPRGCVAVRRHSDGQLVRVLQWSDGFVVQFVADDQLGRHFVHPFATIADAQKHADRAAQLRAHVCSGTCSAWHPAGTAV